METERDLRDLSLLTDLYELTMMQGYFKEGKEDVAVFDAFYRQNPCGNGYAISCGLDQIIQYIKDLRFSYESIDYLRSLGIFDEDFLQYLSGFHFTGDIYAIPEGTVMFPREPMIKVIAPILQAQLIELDKGHGDSESSFKSIFDNIPSGEEGDSIIREAADYLFIAVKDIQRFSAPDSFLIICSSAFVAERIATCLRERLAKEKDFFARKDPSIIGMGYDTSLALRGATELVFADFFGKKAKS